METVRPIIRQVMISEQRWNSPYPWHSLNHLFCFSSIDVCLCVACVFTHSHCTFKAGREQCRWNDKQQSRKKNAWQNYDENRLWILFLIFFCNLYWSLLKRQLWQWGLSFSLASSIRSSPFMACIIRWKTIMVYSNELSKHRCMCTYILKIDLCPNCLERTSFKFPSFSERRRETCKSTWGGLNFPNDKSQTDSLEGAARKKLSRSS